MRNFTHLNEQTDSYLTIARLGEAVFRDRGSKFIGMAFPLEKESDFAGLMERARKAYPAARHYCYAWRLGISGDRFRQNDDGEPAGTAGKPIYGQIVSAGLTNVAIIVVRYFGGTLLGTGGLINAYRSAATEALAASERTERFLLAHYRAEFDDADMSGVLRALRSVEAQILKSGYSTRHLLEFTVRKNCTKDLHRKFSDLYRVTLKETDADEKEPPA